MTRRTTKRTKKHYTELFDNPGALLKDASVILWPNGQPVIWIRDGESGRGFEIKAGKGRVGFSVTVRAIGPAAACHVADPNYQVTVPPDAREVTLCQYDDTDHARAFRAWYEHDARSERDPEKQHELWERYESLSAAAGERP